MASDIHALGRIANSAFNGKPPRNWSAIICRATSLIPEQRYPSVDEFAVEIRRRNRGRQIAMCSLAFVLLAGGVVLAWLWGRR